MIPSQLQLITVGKVLQLKIMYNVYDIQYILFYIHIFKTHFHTRFRKSALGFQNGLTWTDQLFERSAEILFHNRVGSYGSG